MRPSTTRHAKPIRAISASRLKILMQFPEQARCAARTAPQRAKRLESIDARSGCGFRDRRQSSFLQAAYSPPRGHAFCLSVHRIARAHRKQRRSVGFAQGDADRTGEKSAREFVTHVRRNVQATRMISERKSRNIINLYVLCKVIDISLTFVSNSIAPRFSASGHGEGEFQWEY